MSVSGCHGGLQWQDALDAAFETGLVASNTPTIDDKANRMEPGLEAVADDATLATPGEPLNYTPLIKGFDSKAVYLVMVDNPPLHVWQ